MPNELKRRAHLPEYKESTRQDNEKQNGDADGGWEKTNSNEHIGVDSSKLLFFFGVERKLKTQDGSVQFSSFAFIVRIQKPERERRWRGRTGTVECVLNHKSKMELLQRDIKCDEWTRNAVSSRSSCQQHANVMSWDEEANHHMYGSYLCHFLDQVNVRMFASEQAS